MSNEENYKLSGQEDQDELFTLANQNRLPELTDEEVKEYLEAANRLLTLKYNEEEISDA